MANPMRGEAMFEALGKTWTLRFNTNALCEFEETAGVPVSAVRISSGIRFSHLRALLWSGLGFHHKRDRGSLDNAGLMIDDAGATVLAEAVTQGLSTAFPAKGGDEASPPVAAQDGAGSTS